MLNYFTTMVILTHLPFFKEPILVKKAGISHLSKSEVQFKYRIVTYNFTSLN